MLLPTPVPMTGARRGPGGGLCRGVCGSCADTCAAIVVCVAKTGYWGDSLNSGTRSAMPTARPNPHPCSLLESTFEVDVLSSRLQSTLDLSVFESPVVFSF